MRRLVPSFFGMLRKVGVQLCSFRRLRCMQDDMPIVFDNLQGNLSGCAKQQTQHVFVVQG